MQAAAWEAVRLPLEARFLRRDRAAIPHLSLNISVKNSSIKH